MNIFTFFLNILFYFNIHLNIFTTIKKAACLKGLKRQTATRAPIAIGDFGEVLREKELHFYFFINYFGLFFQGLYL